MQELFGPADKIRIPAEGPIDYVGRLDDGMQYMTFVTGAVPDGYVFKLDNEDWRKVKHWIGVLAYKKPHYGPWNILSSEHPC